ncbi:hypothetical protein [Klebsiella pneumoniae]|uniref:hypothetical protein n=1 Tax=Klebsiella pneumoniae TaxID=573 RepID=UPI0040556BD2
MVTCSIGSSGNLTAENLSVAVIGEDVDLVVLLVALTPRNHSGDVFFVKPGRRNVPTKVYSVHRLQQLPFASNILLLHSFSGCDTTSAIYGKSKVTTVKIFTENPSVISDVASCFNHPSSTPEEIGRAGEILFLAILKAPHHHTNLNKLRYHAFLKASVRLNADLTTLPPTRGSALQHSLRAYLQVLT